jgi:hypothetical protein
MPYKPTGQMVGNTPASRSESDAPSNRPTVPGGVTGQPAGATMLAWGEGADSSSWNRGLTQLGKNTDWLRGKLTKPFAIPIVLGDALFPDLSAATGTEIDLALAPGWDEWDGWVFVSPSQSTVKDVIHLTTSSGAPYYTPAGTKVTVSSVKTTADVVLAGVGITLVAAEPVLAPSVSTDARHILRVNSAALSSEIGSGTAKGLMVTVSASAATTASEGTNNGRYTVVDGTGDGSDFVLSEHANRARYYGLTGAFVHMDPFTTSSGGSGTMIITGTDYFEVSGLTGTIKAGDTVTTAGGSATVSRYSEAGDAVVLNNNMSASGLATFDTDGKWVNVRYSSGVKLTLNTALVAATDLKLRFGRMATLDTLDSMDFVYTSSLPPAGDLDLAYRSGQAITADLGPVAISTANTAEALVLTRTAGSGDVAPFQVKDGVITQVAVHLDDPVSDHPDYLYANRLLTNWLCSYTNRVAASSATASVLLTNGSVSLRSSQGGGSGTESTVLTATKTAAGATEVLVQGRTSALGDTTRLEVNSVKGLYVQQEYKDYRLITLASATGSFAVGETVTQATTLATGLVQHVGAGYLEIAPATGTWNTSDAITGGTSLATAELADTVVGRSATTIGQTGAATPNKELLTLSPVGGFQEADATGQSGLMVVPDLRLMSPKIITLDAQVTAITSTGGSWKPAVTLDGSNVAFGMQGGGASSDVAYLHVPPYVNGVSSIVVSYDTLASGTPRVGQLVYGIDTGVYLGVIADVLGSQLRLLVTQSHTISNNEAVGGGWANVAAAPSWTAVLRSPISLGALSLSDSKPRLAGVEVMVRGFLQNGEALSLTLLQADTTTGINASVDYVPYTKSGAGTFSKTFLLGAELAAPSAAGNISYAVSIYTGAWNAASRLHLLKVRSFVQVFEHHPAV